MDKHKAIYKLAKSNRYTLEDIAAIVDMSQEEVMRVFRSFGETTPLSQVIVGQERVISNLVELIKAGKHAILHGEPGIGKTISAKEAVKRAGKVLKMCNLSDLRNGTLLAKWLYGSHQTPSDVVFVFDEIDNFHWQSHAYFKKVLEESKVSIIMTCNDLEAVSKAVVEQVKKGGAVIHVFPPTRDDLKKLLEMKFPDRVGAVDQLYDRDFRVVMRRLLYNVYDTRVPEVVVKTPRVIGAIFGERVFSRRIDAIKKDADPIAWLTAWLDYNAGRIVPPPMLCDFLDQLSRTEARMFKTGTRYLQRMYASLPCPGRRVAVDFPGALFNAEREPRKEEPAEEVKKVKVEVVVEGNNTFDPFGF